ncbi:MAG: hypothetical protein PHT27_07600 [Candidatus Izemoplasmatales bacterium]|nr:hypothetical protein [Candidatus Izemoplasmatales bacterium]
MRIKKGVSHPHSTEALACPFMNTERHATVFVVCQPRFMNIKGQFSVETLAVVFSLY